MNSKIQVYEATKEYVVYAEYYEKEIVLKRIEFMSQKTQRCFLVHYMEIMTVVWKDNSITAIGFDVEGNLFAEEHQKHKSIAIVYSSGITVANDYYVANAISETIIIVNKGLDCITICWNGAGFYIENCHTDFNVTSVIGSAKGTILVGKKFLAKKKYILQLIFHAKLKQTYSIWLSDNQLELLKCAKEGIKLVYILEYGSILEKKTESSSDLYYQKNDIKQPTIMENISLYSGCIFEDHSELVICSATVDNPIVVTAISKKTGKYRELYRLAFSQYRDRFIVHTLVYEQKHNMLKISKKQKRDNNNDIYYLHGGPNYNWNASYSHFFHKLVSQYGNVFIPAYHEKRDSWDGTDIDLVNSLSSEHTYRNKILFGESYGAFLAFQVWRKDPNRWHAMVLYAPFFSPETLEKTSGNDAVKNTIRRRNTDLLNRIASENNKNEKSECCTKVYIIRGKNDLIIPEDETMRVFEYLQVNYSWKNSKPVYEEIDGVGHSPLGIKQEILFNDKMEGIFELITH